MRDLPECFGGLHRKVRKRRSVGIKGPQTLLRIQILGVLQKWCRGSTVLKLTSRKTENCEVCKRTKTTRALCRKRTGDAALRAESFGDLKTADHKVLNERSESRNNRRYAVVVQDLAIRWIQSYPCKTETSQEKEKSSRKFLEPSKVVHTHNSLEFGKSCEDLSWNHRTSTPHRSETNGIAERVVRKINEGTSAVLLQSGLDEKWWADSVDCSSAW